MSLLRNVVERRGANPLLPWGSDRIPQNWETGLMSAGVAINEDTALAVGTVMTCVSILASDISTLPLYTYKRTKDRSKVRIDPQPPVVDNPWPEGTRQDWVFQVMVSLTLRGNFYGRIVDRDAGGYPTVIMPIHPDRVTARRDDRTGKRVYRINGEVIPTDDMFHIPAFLVPGSFVGLNPVEYQRSSWGIAAAAERYGSQFFANSANPSGVITVEHDLQEEETLELARAWKQAHGGLGQAQTPAVLTGGAQWHQISINPDDAQFLQTRDFQRHEIASFFGIPEHRLGFQDRTSSWGTGIEQMEIGYWINTLGGWAKRIEAYMSLPSVTPRSNVVRFDMSERLRGDTLQRFQAYQIARNGGWLNVDEIREKEDMPPVPDGKGQDYLQPLNMGLLGDKPEPPNDSGFGGGGGDPASAPSAPSAPRSRRVERDDHGNIVRLVDEDA